MTTEKTTKPPQKHRLQIIRHVVPVETSAPQASTKDSFHKISQSVSNKLGSPTAFLLATMLIIVWASSGPLFGFSDTWQLVINTTTTIVTFLMVFAIQNTQNRDARAMQLKLSELIRANRAAHTEFVDIEDLSDTELDAIQNDFKTIHEKFQKHQK